ncbi:hypothetical protein GCM10010273_60040 [Streptomyces lavendulocolor]
MPEAVRGPPVNSCTAAEAPPPTRAAATATAAISPTGRLLPARRCAVGGYDGGGGKAKGGCGSGEEWSVMGTTLGSVHESRLRTS